MAAQTPKKDLKNLQHAQDVPEELEAVKEWWNAHGNIVTIVLVVILVIVLGIRQYRSWRASQTEQQSMALLQAAGPADFETIVQENKSPEMVAIARLHLAAAYYADNKFEMAAGVYRDFLKDTPRHAMADTARAVDTAAMVSIAYSFLNPLG